MRVICSIGCLLLWPLWGYAQVWEREGPPPLLIELYTSEGCSSCPPADRRLTTLLEHPQLWRELVPVAFHVDYWDYLGWPDRFARPAYSARQRALYRNGQLRAVYTPGWLIDGREWRGFFSGQPWPPVPRRDGGRLRAELQAQLLQIAYHPTGTGTAQAQRVEVALLAFDQHTRVAGGENSGRRLDHQFVVRAWLRGEGTGPWTLTLPRDGSGRQALVVWVSAAQRAEPLQVVGGWLDEGWPLDGQ